MSVIQHAGLWLGAPRRGRVVGITLVALVVLAAMAVALVFNVTRSSNPASGQEGTDHAAAWSVAEPQDPATGAVEADATAPALVEVARGPGWASLLAPGGSTANTVLALTYDAQQPHLDLVDRATGSIIGRIETSYNPVVVRRASAGEILVSDMGIEQTATGPVQHPRLLVFDGAQLSLARTIPMPHRDTFAVYAQVMALSGNERYLFYVAREQADLPECPGDAAICDVHSVVRIDLQDTTGAAVVAKLPQDCGLASLRPVDRDQVLATCVNRAVAQLIDSTGRITRTADCSGGVGLDTAIPERRKNPLRSMSGFVTPAGEPGVVLVDGTLLWMKSDGSLDRTGVLPPGVRVAPDQVYQPEAQTLVVAYGSYGEAQVSGFVAVDLGSMTVIRDVAVQDVRHVAPAGGGRLLALRSDGMVQAIDASPGAQPTHVGTAPQTAEVLIP
jgi:hypothetical protein